MPPYESPQQRIPLAKLRVLWACSREASGDDLIGLKTGWHAKPTHFYAFGYSWLASSNLLGGMRRLTRYYQVMSTASVEVRLTETGDSFALSATFPDETRAPPQEGIDCGLTALLALCDTVAERKIRPLRVDSVRQEDQSADEFRAALGSPVRFGATLGALHFDKDDLLAPLPHGTPDIAQATDRIAEQYIETLDPHKVASQVRRMLIDLLPSGKVDQDLVSSRLNRSTSTLQRQLQGEGRNYRSVLEETQRSLAEKYLRDNRHSLAQVAYLVGFSDQSNFSRAFKRWTSMSPRQFQATQHDSNS